MVRFWLGGGRGNFGLSPKECLGTSFYCIMTTLPEGNPTLNPDSDYLRWAMDLHTYSRIHVDELLVVLC